MDDTTLKEACAEFKTEKGSKYIAQLCKHFAHKVEVEYSDYEGRAELPGSKARMIYDDNTLKFHVTSNSNEGLLRGMFIIQDHIVRFAFRENLKELNWVSRDAQLS